MSMFCPLSITESGSMVWEQRSPNNPLTYRPLALQMGKESIDFLQSLAIFNLDQTLLKRIGCSIIVGNVEMQLKVHVESHMMDMKAAHLYLGLGGAYCDLCNCSRVLCHDPVQVEEGFEITRNVDDLQNLFNDLVQDDGTILKKHHDYEKRTGLTSKPIPTNDVLSVQVLHALLRTFDHFMKVAVHLQAGVLDWLETPTSINKQFLVRAKTEIQKKIEEETGERWDLPDQTGKGGTTTNGNTAWNILHHGRHLVIEMMPKHFQDIMKQFGQQLSVIIWVFSSSEMVNVVEFKKLCTGLYLLLLNSFPRVTNKQHKGPWISITPSLHKLLGHAWELIELNGNRGLRKLDESGLEGNNKILRGSRLRLARKTSQNAKLEDTIRRLWLGCEFSSYESTAIL